MSGNSAFQLVNERGWRRGLGNMLVSELSRWWKTRMWWVQSLIWVGMIGFLLGAVLFSTQAGSPGTGPIDDSVMLYCVFAGLFPAVGVIIIMQSVVVGEKKSGTAAWVLSKPVTRPAFLLSKGIANSLGVLVTMVVLPGAAAFAMKAIATGASWNPLNFLAVLGVIFLHQFFFLSLTLMLGTLFNNRGAVIGIPMALLFFQQNLIGLAPFLGYVLPWKLVIPVGQQVDAIAPSLLLGTHNYSLLLVLTIALESILFILIGLIRFRREEF